MFHSSLLVVHHEPIVLSTSFDRKMKGNTAYGVPEHAHQSVSCKISLNRQNYVDVGK